MTDTILFQNQKVAQLTTENSSALFAPQYGGRLLQWKVKGQSIIHWPNEKIANWSNPAKIRGGNPLLFPFIARHMVDGEIGKWKSIEDESKIHEMPVHGFARNSEFTIKPSSTSPSEPTEIRMQLSSSAETFRYYPYNFHFVATYQLSQDSLTCSLSVTNRSDKPLPYYSGHHFYFSIPAQERADWQLHLPCEKWAWQQPDGEMKFAPSTQDTHQLDDTALIDRMHVIDEQNPVHLINSKKSLKIEILLDEKNNPSPVPWYAVTSWTENENSDFYCVEPWLGLPNAIHHRYGLRLLSPGQTETATCTLKAHL